MNIYKYEMYFNNTWNDISSYVETNSTIGDRLDKTFNIASFVLPHIKSDKFVGIDLSVAIKPWIPVKVTIGSDVYRFYTSDCSRTIIKKTTPRLYKHEVQLVEATRILQRKTIADTTVTQPKSTQFTSLYMSEYKTLTKQTINNTEVSPTLTLISNSKNTSIVDGNTLKAGYSGQVLVSFDVENFQYNRDANINNAWDTFWFENVYTDGEAELRAEIYVNGVLRKPEDRVDFYIPATSIHLDGEWYDLFNRHQVIDTPTVYKPAMSVTLDASLVDQVVTVKLKTLGTWEWESLINKPDQSIPDELQVKTYLTIGGGAGEALAYIYLDELANKCIRSLNQRDINDTDTTNDYRLDPIVEAKLKGKLAPEFTFTNYKAWDALEKIANIENAVPEIKDDFRTITFTYLDDIPDMYYDQDMFYDETLAYSSNEFVSGLELNTPNLIEPDVLLNAKIEPYENGWGTVRTSETLAGQLTDDNAVFKTRQLIHQIYKLYVDGVTVRISKAGESDKYIYGNVISNHEISSDYWDISSRVVTDTEWSTYPDSTATTDSDRRGYATKGNHIYYTQGSNLIKGLGHKTLTVSDIVGSQEAPRAILETIMSKCAELLASDSNYAGWSIYSDKPWIDIITADPEAAIVGSHDTYDGIKYRVEYVPLTVARSTVYKYDAFNSDSYLTDYVNEQDKLNDSENLGKFVSTTLNRQGNLQYTVSGKTQEYGRIPKVGFRTFNDLVVSARDLYLNNRLINYTLQLSKDFINQSDWVARNSQYRAFEISSNDIVFRQDKYTNFIVLTKDINNVLPKGYNIFSDYGNKLFAQNFCNLVGYVTSPISYASVTVVPTIDATPVTFDVPVNAYTIGTTVNLQTELENNYSAGTSVLPKTLNGVNIKVEEYVQYTNEYGQVYSMSTKMYPRGYSNNSSADGDAYPTYVSVPTAGTDVLTLNMLVEKDSREKYGLNIEIPFITDDSTTLRAFSGIAKYNGLVRRKDDIQVKLALLDSDYFPSVNETKLDTKRTRQIDANEGTYLYDSDNKIYGIKYVSLSIPADLRFNGYVIYEEETKDLVYAVKEDIAMYDENWLYTTDTVWFVPKRNLRDNTRPAE